MKETHRKNITFENHKGQSLSGLIELPADLNTHAFALFAHCFTCGKDLKVIRNISRALTSNGFGVFVFDFTGLGQSEGEFSKSNFSHNVGDLVSAAQFLEKHYMAPSLLVGHSLGGSAVLLAANQIPSSLAVATIGAPYDPAHVTRLFSEKKNEIERKGEAVVHIGGQPFTIEKQFIEDLQLAASKEYINSLGRSLLILHSPQDRIVSIDNARLIYEQARHPKSFISLDGADHLVSKTEDALYIGNVIASWAARYVKNQKPEKLIKTDQQVVAVTGNEGYTTQILAGEHYFLADEPKSVGGDDLGPSPYGLLLAALGACTGMTLRMYADRKGWAMDEVAVHLSHEKVHMKDSELGAMIDKIDRYLEIKGDLTEIQLQKLEEIANKCPVHKTLHGTVQVITYLKP